MKHEYDWSKLDAGWSYIPARSHRGVITDGDGMLTVEAAESGDIPGNVSAYWVEFHGKARAQLAKCRFEPKPVFYAWSKLDKEWVYHEQPWQSLYSTRWAMHFPLAEILSLTDPSSTGTPHPGYFEARAQLDKCRIAANVHDGACKAAEYEPLNPGDVGQGDASEFAAQSPKYNWNKLENTGWRVGNGAYITNGKFNYWYTLGDRPKLEAITDKFHGSDALQAEQAAEVAVELCRRDWRREFDQARCGTGLDFSLKGASCASVADTVWLHGSKFTISVIDSATITDVNTLLSLAKLVERLQKLGWVEELERDKDKEGET